MLILLLSKYQRSRKTLNNKRNSLNKRHDCSLAEWTRENNIEANITFRDEKKWNYFKDVFTKTSVEGFVAATKALYTMPDGKDDVTLALKDADIQLFGIVGNEDKVFVQLMEKMKKDKLRFEISNRRM